MKKILLCFTVLCFCSCGNRPGNPEAQQPVVDQKNIPLVTTHDNTGNRDSNTVVYDRLSRQYRFRVLFTHPHSYTLADNVMNNVWITVTDNTTHTDRQCFHARLGAVYQAFETAEAARSYSTGYRKDAEICNNDYGDLVVADLNFDGREDLAVKFDDMGNGGTQYCFFVQDRQGVFTADDYLTRQLVYFPSVIDPKNKTLFTCVRSSCFGFDKTTYTYQPKAGTWSQLQSVFVDARH